MNRVAAGKQCSQSKRVPAPQHRNEHPQRYALNEIDRRKHLVSQRRKAGSRIISRHHSSARRPEGMGMLQTVNLFVCRLAGDLPASSAVRLRTVTVSLLIPGHACPKRST
jgi:hypothetical protein